MGLVTLAALCVAGFAIIFRLFERYRVELLPAIAINYAVAFCCGLLVAPPWNVGGMHTLLIPAALLGSLFVLSFSLAGLSAQKAGAARTTIAGRMSLVLTIAGTIIIFNERIGVWTVLGIVLALAGLVLTSMAQRNGDRAQGQWLLPFLLFLCSGAADIGLTYIQRVLTTAANAPTFPTLCFGASTLASVLLLFIRREQGALRHARTWAGGVVLGVVNYGSLLFLMQALGESGLAASILFPAMNILAILFATAAGLLLFKERLSVMQWCGITLCIASLTLIMGTNA
ncbi:MAG: DMT family transporter [Flavobacteriales bacterium]|nr:DMT family transporter [Flavobacteriales bacterium]